MRSCMRNRGEKGEGGGGIEERQTTILRNLGLGSSGSATPQLPSTTIDTVGERDFRHRYAWLGITGVRHTGIGVIRSETGCY